MPAPTIEAYVRAFVARSRRARRAGQQVVDDRGVHGLIASSPDDKVRLLVTDDRAMDVVAAQLVLGAPGRIKVLDAAVGCRRLVRDHDGWHEVPDLRTTLMGAADLPSGPVAALPHGLTLHRVARLPDDPPGWVSLTDAVDLIARANPDESFSKAGLAGHLRSSPEDLRLFAALDPDGAVRATSGVGLSEHGADVVFVNTDLGRRGEGVGRAMTSAALHHASAGGARSALLDATEAGRGVYERLGFAVLAEADVFEREAT